MKRTKKTVSIAKTAKRKKVTLKNNNNQLTQLDKQAMLPKTVFYLPTLILVLKDLEMKELITTDTYITLDALTTLLNQHNDLNNQYAVALKNAISMPLQNN